MAPRPDRICRPTSVYSCGELWMVNCGCNAYLGAPAASPGQARMQLVRTHGVTPLPAHGCSRCGAQPSADDRAAAHAYPWGYYQVVFDRERQHEVFVCRDEQACRGRYLELAAFADVPVGGTSRRGLTREGAKRLRDQYGLARDAAGVRDPAGGRQRPLRDSVAGQRLCELLEHHIRHGATLPQLAEALAKKPGHMHNMLVNLGLGELPVTGRARTQ